MCHRIRLYAALFALVVLSACATATPYRPLKGNYGYQDQQIESNRYRVSFQGNAATSRNAVVDYMLYRSAQITVDHGYDYFILAQHTTERSTSYLNTGPVMLPYTACNAYYYSPYCWNPLYTRSTTSYPINSYKAQAIIVLGKGSKPEKNVHAYDAKQVLKNLSPLVKKHGGR